MFKQLNLTWEMQKRWVGDGLMYGHLCTVRDYKVDSCHYHTIHHTQHRHPILPSRPNTQDFLMVRSSIPARPAARSSKSTVVALTAIQHMHKQT